MNPKTLSDAKTLSRDAIRAVHEEMWRVQETPYGKGQRVVVRKADGRTVAEFPSYDPTSAAARIPNATLCAAAPDMARRLLEYVQACDGCGGTGIQWIRVSETERVAVACNGCSDDRATLKKAGVIE